jgi:2-C-methyl-D-erythritol 4-phosphate cytidylyltransferase
MNTALIFAGGSGTRMNSTAQPKQFLQLYGKEIIIHTIENFERHPEIDGIAVVCIESWIPFLKTVLEKYNIGKVKWLVSGGKTGHESIYRGLSAIKNDVTDDSIVLVHDGVRPLITQELVSNCIASVLAYGNAITVTPEIETVVSIDNHNGRIMDITDRSKCFNAKAPQCFRFADLWQGHTLAKTDGLTDMIDSASLMRHYGYELYAVQGNFENIKITTASDFYVFRALYEARENLQVFGLSEAERSI